MKCARTACSVLIDNVEHYAIWNDVVTTPRLYCLKCGNGILRFNQQDTLKLKYELRRYDEDHQEGQHAQQEDLQGSVQPLQQ